ncbi:L-cysteine desulfidase family protein [Clostridium sp. Marseille-P299]|uniref:L-cysteine desulfidase family protein n=1 Tax=Clostridium sp. Marseille-P299 TaxID=1805477 RepID=UPI0008328999|nr:L-serine ammonia-lyase, iron-sulfur-dependent, subunit alpha [Clostridium sp. Marseille-P299]
MVLTKEKYDTYVKILKEELVPAFGCTEPIAIAYCAAKAREILGKYPDQVVIEASSNIIKNVKSVIVPNTGGLKGIPAATAAGIVAGDASKELEVISHVSDEKKEEIRNYLENTQFKVMPLEGGDKLDIRITVSSGEDTTVVRIAKHHTNLVRIEKNSEVMWQAQEDTTITTDKADRSLLSVEDIILFAQEVTLSDVEEVLERQVEYNYKIAEEGMAKDWGANLGSVLLNTQGNDIRTRAKAMAAAGSDARMSGCELPVVINSGSGNQGITVSVPIIVYAKELNVAKEEMYRALVVSNLIAVHIKNGIGSLSAFCGAVSAGCAAGCGIAYLMGDRTEVISHALVNALAIVSGIICDGAKASCAGKIAVSVDAGILGYLMYKEGQQFYAEDGIVSKGVEKTIQNIYRLAARGMSETDEEIIRIMTQCD